MIEIAIFRIDQFSFWMGFLAGLLFAWLFSRAVKVMPVFFRAVVHQIQQTRENLTTGIENRIRQDVLNWAQRQHLAASLFSLDEILILPRLLAPPLYTEREEHYDQLDIASLTVPYMPDWPEMASSYGSPTLTLAEALKNGADILLIGQPGSGKTVALASLASQLAQRDPSIGELSRLFPLLIPAQALLPQAKMDETLDALVQSISGLYISPVIRPRLKNVLRYLLQSGRVLLLLDGLDELSRKANQDLNDFLVRLRADFPNIRLVVAAYPADFAGLNLLGLVPLSIAVWNENDKEQFIDKWHKVWSKFIQPDELSTTDFVDPLLLEKWLAFREINHSPFDITLKTWGTFAGDILGPGRINVMRAHIRRMTAGFSNADSLLQAIAVEMVSKMSPSISQRDAENAANRSGKAVVTTPLSSDADIDAANKPTNEKQGDSHPVSSGHLIHSLLGNGFFVTFSGSQITFCHPLFMGYFAGSGMSESSNQPVLNDQPEWMGKDITLGFMSAQDHITDLIENLLEESKKTPIQHQLFLISRWLQIAPPDSPWRPPVMRQLLNILQRDYETLSLAGRAVSAMALSEDPGVGNLFRQLAKSDQSQVRQLAALGLGLIGDSRFVPELNSLTEDISPTTSRAACLGLVGIGNRVAIDSVIAVLLHGSEDMRRAAAEALVNLHEEGVEILKEGLTMEDILVRRAVIYGIARVKDHELVELLEKTAVQDGQWVVRNAAAQTLEKLQQPNPYIPQPFKPLTQQSWLINYAGKSGIGVGDEKQGYALVLQAMERGETEERLIALTYLNQFPNKDAVPRIYGVYYGSQDVVRDASFDVIWHSSASGIELPSPIQFGLG